MTARRVFIAGEGRHELGDFCRDPPFRSGAPGLVEILVRRVATVPVVVADGICWKAIRKYRFGGFASADERAVVGLHLLALEAGCDVVVFVRDEDGEPDRREAVKRGLAQARERFPRVSAIGAVAVQSLDGWTLAMLGHDRTESLKPARAKSQLDSLGSDSTEARVEIASKVALEALPADAASLRAFVDAARTHLGE